MKDKYYWVEREYKTHNELTVGSYCASSNEWYLFGNECGFTDENFRTNWKVMEEIKRLNDKFPTHKER